VQRVGGQVLVCQNDDNRTLRCDFAANLETFAFWELEVQQHHVDLAIWAKWPPPCRTIYFTT
jgi:hypothetical protein